MSALGFLALDGLPVFAAPVGFKPKGKTKLVFEKFFPHGKSPHGGRIVASLRENPSCRRQPIARHLQWINRVDQAQKGGNMKSCVRGIIVGVALVFAPEVSAEPHLYMAGDSIMTEYKSDMFPQYGWGQALKAFMKDPSHLHNFARSGWSARRFRESGRWENCIASKLNAGDWVIVSFGHNDMNRRRNKLPKNDYSTPEEYKAFLRGFASDVRAKGADIAFATSIAHSSGFSETNGAMRVDGGATGLGTYVAAMREVAAEVDAPLLDLNRYAEVNLPKMGLAAAKSLYMVIKPGEYPNYPEGKNDPAHIRYGGAFFYAKAAVEMSREQGLSLARLWKEPETFNAVSTNGLTETNWEARELELPTDFLGGGEWRVEALEDAPDAATNAMHYVRSNKL